MWSRFLPALLVGLVAVAVFLPTLRNGFVDWDDDRNIVNNPEFRGLAWSNIRWMFTTFLMGHYQPLSWLTLGLDYTIWGMNPVGYHLSNSLLHGLSTVLLTMVVARLIAARPTADQSPSALAESPVPDSRAMWAGAAVALLWAVHPLRVEAVAWVTQRREVLCSVLTLATILHHLRGGRWWSVALLAGVAMIAKATAVVLPVLLVLIDVYRSGALGRLQLGPSGGAWRASVRIVTKHGALIVLAAACSITAIRAQKDAEALVDVQQLGWMGRLTQYFFSVGFYFLKTVWPTHLYPLYESRTYQVGDQVLWDSSELRPIAITAAACTAVVLVAGWLLRRILPAVLLLTGSYLAMIAPVGGLGQSGLQVAADRYAYQPGWVLTLAICAAIAALALRSADAATPRRLLGLATVACATVLAVLSVRLEAIWQTGETLWIRVMQEDPRSGTAKYNLGMVYQQRMPADDARAEPLLREALQMHPWLAERSTALAALLVRTGREEEAIPLYQRSLKNNPNLKPTLFLLGNLLFNKGQVDEALKMFDRLAAIDPTNPESYRILGRATAAAGRARDAIGVVDEGVKRVPNSGELWQLRAWLCSTSIDDSARDARKAVESAERALALAGTKRDNALIVCVAAAYAEAGRFDDADRFLEDAIRTADERAKGPLGSMRKQMQAHQPVRAPARFP